MTDKARKQTDKELAHLERKIYRLYATASDEISAEWRKYMQSHKKKLDRLYDELQKAKKSSDNDAIKAAKEEYERAVKNVTLNDKRYKAMLNETTAKIANVNQIALDYVNGDMPKIYTLNYNAFDDEKIDGYTFTLVNERAVENLIKSNKIELPPKKVNIPKDQAWNAKNINSQLLQGIIQGESIAKIAKRLQNVTDMNKKSAIRNARTMVTGAENKGRQDSFKKAQDDGVIMEREWIAAHDDRTRAWHLDLHGVRVGVDEPWENDYGEIMFPGDPTADPANVYNCRCSIRAHVKGFKWNEKLEEQLEKPDDILIDLKSKLDFDDLDFQTLANAKEEAGFDGNNWNFFKEYQSGNIDSKILDDILLRTNKVEKHKTIQGKDISNTWTRRSKEFDFAIDDILNAQGFDGLPRVVDAEEFDRYVQESNIIMQRGYRAPDKETLKAYQDTLYNGKWYIDCSEGGSIYGKGMYTVYNKGTTIIDDIADTAKDYARPNRLRGLNAGTVETITLTPDAKIIKYEEIKDMLSEYNKIHPKIDEGSLAALYGYDAISVGQNDMGYLVILNRTKIIIKENIL